MPEIKHNFTGGKMNKDVDQRLVPKGEYRDAMNIQVSTSEGSDVGTVQNILGNKLVDGLSFLSPGSTCVGAIADEKNDAFYWLVANQVPLALQESGPLGAGKMQTTVNVSVGNYILEHKNNTASVVFADLFYKSVFQSGPINQFQLAPNLTIPASNHSFSVGDIINEISFTSTFETNLSLEVVATTGSSFTVDISTLSTSLINTILASNIARFVASQPIVLGFNPNNMITGINIIDDMLFWTDGETEPKKINIPRSIEGTPSGNSHTKLIVNGIDKGPIKEKHITVIKRAPKKAVSMTLTTSRDPNLNYSGIFTISDASNLVQSSLWDQRNPLNLNANNPYDLSTFTTEEGSNIIKVIIKSDLNGNTNFGLDGFGVGTRVAIKEVDASGNIPQIPINDYTIKGVVTDWLWTNSSGVTSDVNSFTSSNYWGVTLAIKVNSISRTPQIATSGTLDYVIDLFDESEKLYEFKLPRFSYRYKYEDGEYSHFAPWTDIAFKPGSFDYHPKKGYNLGMTNMVQTVQLRDFITSDTPLDVVEIDILYKEEKSPNIYVVDTFKPSDYPTILDGSGGFSNNWSLNKYEISKENIMSILPSNQLLRSYDNVPRKALAQDITGNRVVYGNYVQNYNLDTDGIGYKPRISHELMHDPSTLKSIKSLREYQLGVVFTDKYGRETPVLTNNTGTFKVDKNQGINKNKLQVSLANATNPLGMEFFKFYIKQTSGEYYNMAMDRWYDAEDGNVWVSFNSADRNKINDDTVLVLKKGVDSEELVEDPARFKVVAIENEAPDFIKIKKTIISDKAHQAGGVATNIFLTGGDLPEQDSTRFSIAYHDNGTHIYSNTVVKDIYNQAQHQGEDFYFQIKNAAGTTSTKPIKIAKINITDEDWATNNALTKYEIVLEEPFTSLINSFTDDSQGQNSSKILDGNRAVFWSYKKENRAEFDGRFFVKLFQEDTFKEYIIDNTSAEVTEYNTLWDQKVYSFDYGSHNLVWNGASGSFPGGGSSYAVGIPTNTPKWEDYIDATDEIAQDGSSGYSIQNWKICEAFFRGINVHRAKNSVGGAPGFTSHGISERQGFDGMDLHGDPSSWDFEDVWFLDGAESDGYYSGHWDGSPQITNHNGIGISSDMMELGFGGIQPQGSDGWEWHYDAGGSQGNDTDFYKLSDNNHYDNDSEGSGLASRLTAGVYFRWAEDPTETVYKITNTADHNLVRHETDQLGGDQRSAALGQTASPYPLYNNIAYHTSTFFRPGNHSKNYVLKVSQIDDPNNTTMPWNPYTSGEISGGLILPLVVSTGMSSGGNQVTLNTLTVVDASGFGYGARTLQVGMVCEELEAIVSRISGTTIYFKNYDSNTANPTYAAVSAGDTLTFKQYGMNGISRNSAKNINYWNNGKGFSASNVGVDAVGYTIEILEPEITETMFPRFPAIFETEPVEETGLDIYYEMTDNIPVAITKENMAHLIPAGSEVAISAQDPVFGYQDGFAVSGTNVYTASSGSDILLNTYLGGAPIAIGDEVIIKTPSGVKFSLLIEGITTTTSSPLLTILKLSSNLTSQKITPTWFNCYSFGNGVESDRVRDLFNKTYISNGVKVSAVLDETYKKEHKKYSLIYSGIYNSTSGVNNLNQFIAAEKITKDINPIYGSIQKLKSGWGQGGDLIALCEDRVLKILANKDALYNADGNTNITSTNNVLGQAIPYSGEYGISKNPESFASEAYRVYFTDKVRGTVMRLSMDGLTPISNHGMKDWFRDKLKLGDKLIGSYDDKKDEYNITIKGDTIAKTVTFKEDVKGWVSFKSFTPENAISCANEYYTFLDGRAWKHHDETKPRNTFYDHALAPSTLEVVFNEVPGSVKSFKTINYEGSQAKVTSKDENGVTFMDGEYFNLSDVDGWHVENIVTNLEQGGITEFVNKEGKWFGYVTGNDVTHNLNGDVSGNYYTEDFSIQGVGRTISAVNSTVFGCTNPNTYNYNPAANQDDGSCVAIVYGCLDPNADNYYPGANVDSGDCAYLGCTTAPLAVWNNQNAGGSINYDPNANQDDGSCIEAVFGCTDSTMFNYNSLANVGTAILSDGTSCGYENCACVPVIYGCTDPNADNYITPVDEMQDVNTDDGSCIYNGCTDPYADNYGFADPTTAPPGWDGIVGVNISGSISYVWLNGTAVDDGSCTYPGGCTDSTACNYDSTPGMVDNGSCQYCGDDDAVNYDGAQDTSCTTNCTYCEQPVPLTISAQATSDANMNNGSVTLEWAQSTSATIQYYEITINNGNSINVNPSGNATETHAINNLAPGTYNFQVIAHCTQTSVTGTVSATPIFIQTHITVTPVPGCTDYGQTYYGGVTNLAGGTWGACNYNPLATQDDGSCEYTTCTGCKDPLYVEYCGDCWDAANQVVVASGGNNWVADTIPTSCLTLIVYGCTDATAFNYNSLATVDDGSCVPVVLGCMDSTLNNNGTYAASNYAGPGSNVTPEANTDDGSCLPYNCPVVDIVGGGSGIQVNYGLAATAYSQNMAAGGYPNDFTLGLTVTSSTGTILFSEANYGGMSAGSNYVHYDNISPAAISAIALGQTAITFLFTVDSNDGLCSISKTATYTVGCTDPLANSYDPNFDITDNSQCAYSGCTDSTPAVMNWNAGASTNYDPNATISCGTNNDNECCTYHDDQDIEAVVIGSASYPMVRLTYEPGSTGYTEAIFSSLTLGETPGTVVTANNQYSKSNMTSSAFTRLAVMLTPTVWETYVHNNQLKITANAEFNGACDNNFLSNQLPTGSVSKTFTWSVGCKGDNTAINYDPNVDLGMASTCIAANPGCQDSTATNYDASANQDCTSNGSANPNDCCCYTCGEPTLVANTGVVVDTWDDPNTPVYATQITFSFAAVSTAASYDIYIKPPGLAASYITINPFVPTTITNGIATYTHTNTNAGIFLNETAYDFKVIARCENNDGDSCGSTATPLSNIQIISN